MEEKPIPKSSIANGTPRSARVCMASREAASLPMPSRSVISSTRVAPSILLMASSTLPTKPGSRICLAEMFPDTWTSPPAARLRAGHDRDVAARGSPARGPGWGGLLQHDVAQRHDEARLLGDPDEHVRWDVDAVGLPPGERLDADDVAGRGADDGLVDERQVPSRHRRSQRLDEL